MPTKVSHWRDDRFKDQIMNWLCEQNTAHTVLFASCPVSCTLCPGNNPPPKPNREFPVGENTSDISNLRLGATRVNWQLRTMFKPNCRDTDYIYIRTYIPLLFRILSCSEFDKRHVNSIFRFSIPN